MQLTKKQQCVIDLLAEHGEMSLGELVQRVGWWYYHNARKYVGLICSRLIELGRIERVKPGVYKLNDRYGIQGSLFDGRTDEVQR